MSRPSVALWKQAPLIRIAFPFFAGIILQYEFSIPDKTILGFGLSAAIMYGTFLFAPIRRRYGNQWIQGLLLMLICLFTGSWLSYISDVRHGPDWIGSFGNKTVVLVFSLSEPAAERKKSFKSEAAVEFVYENGKCRRAAGNVLVYFSKDVDRRFLRYGTRIAAAASLQPIRNAGNPGDFDYAGYAARKNIFHSIYVSPANMVCIDSDDRSRSMSFIHASRASIVSVFQKYLHRDKAAAGLAEALVIGYKNDLDKDLLRDYTNTGVVHVIAISGMHLALVYFVLEWIWKITGINRRKILSGLLSILLLWLFSFLTGGSPSVLRSAIMFSFVITGRMISRQGSVFNALTASALFLAVYDPFVLWDAGFLLSHLAVLGLITLQKPISGLIEVQNKWFRKIWEMLAVTTAAQLITLPLCLYYFHQFPNYFLLANLIIIPLSTIVLFGGILLILASPFAVVANATGICLGYLIRLMNGIAGAIGKWPGALIENICFGRTGLVILYAFVFFLSGWLIRKKFVRLKMALISLLIFFAMHSFNEIRDSRRRQFVVYNIKGHSASDIILGNSFYFWGDSLLANDLHLQDSLLSGYRKYLQVSTLAGSYNMEGNQLVRVGNSQMVLAGNYSEPPYHADVLIFNEKKFLPAGRLRDFHAENIVFDGSCKLWKIEKLKTAADSLHLHCHPVALKGAFSFTIPDGIPSS